MRRKKEEDESRECICVGFEGDKKRRCQLEGKRKKSGDSFLAGCGQSGRISARKKDGMREQEKDRANSEV